MEISGIEALPTSTPILVGAVVVVLYLAYHAALPKPIPGIPYNPAATKSLFGDVPELMQFMKRTGQTFQWISDQNVRHNSPIVQVFTRPFSKPWVVLSDFRESQDICLRRSKEFDRSNFFGDVFVGLFPDHHISKSSKDPVFQHNRNLVNHLMTPAFLNKVGFFHCSLQAVVLCKICGADLPVYLQERRGLVSC